MEVRYAVVLFVWFVATAGVHAQSISKLIGARANGMAYTTAALSDTWGIFNNVAGAANSEQSVIACTYDLHPALPGGNRAAAAAVVPLRVGSITAGAYRFGDDIYNEHIISAGYASKLGLASLGASINYIQYRTEGFGSKGVATISLGGIAELTPKLLVGAYITNINQPNITETEKIPTQLTAGLAFRPTDKIFVATEIEKDLEYDPTWRAGLEYRFHEKFCARTGYALNPNTAFFGIGFKSKKVNIDYALQHNTQLNLSHQASVAYQLARK